MEEYSILLVDDDDLSLQAFQLGVDWQKIGITTVRMAHRKQEAIGILESQPVDILLTDIEMPGGSGIELIRWVSEHQPRVVRIFYTCHAEFAYAQEAVKLGALDYLLKPVSCEELASIVQRAIALVRRGREGERLAQILRPEPADDQSAISTVKRYIADNLSLKIQREDLARLVYLNPDYLSKLFHRQEGMTIGEYVTEKRMALAAQLLKNTDLSVADISQRVGITDASYFIKTFKKWAGLTPQQYREKHGG